MWAWAYGAKAERTDASGTSGRSSRLTPPKAGFHQRTCKRRHLSRTFETGCGPLGPEGRSLTENTPFGGFSTGLHRLNQLAALAEILVFGGLATIFAKLEFAGLLNRQHFTAKRLDYASR